jgi:uncharacterized protein YidB (DUF937 family)
LGQRQGQPLDVQVHRGTGLADLGDELGELSHAGLGCQLRSCLGRAPHHTEQAAQLGQGLPPGGHDGVQRLARLLGVLLVEGGPAALGLDDDEAEAVGDGVVQLAGDPAPLGRGR